MGECSRFIVKKRHKKKSIEKVKTDKEKCWRIKTTEI